MSAMYHKPVNGTLQELKDIAEKLRIHSVKSTTASKSGHPTSCSSMAEIVSVLFFHTMRYKLKEPRNVNADRFVLSKGHAAPILYAAWAEAGLFPTSDLMNLRKIDSDLEGHPTPRLNFIDVATGSLGQGLSVACGMAYMAKYYDKASYKTYCLIGDGEAAEGSIWEAISFAGVKKLNNMCAIFDINRLGQSDPTAFEHDMESYKARLESFGFNALVVDGHNVEALCKAFHEFQSSDKPMAVLAKTFKGRGFPGVENLDNWHGKPLGPKAAEAITATEARIMNAGPHTLKAAEPMYDAPAVNISNIRLSTPPQYTVGSMTSVRAAYGSAIAKLAAQCPRLIAVDGDMKNSTYSQAVLKVDPTRHIECYIAEQNMVGVAIGLACRDRSVVFCSTFAAFFTRAFDQLRMGAVSQTNINCVGTHAGISIGHDGPSQMALEDIAMFRSIPDCTVFYPSDATSAERACEIAANTKGICFIRATRNDSPVIYASDTKFKIGVSHVVRQSKEDSCLVIAAGVTLDEAMKAADALAASNIHIRILDPFTIKPLDEAGIKNHAKACGGRIVVVEDHYPEGGMGEAVNSAICQERDIIMKHLAVRAIPRSGLCHELLEMFGIDSTSIQKAVKEIRKL